MVDLDQTSGYPQAGEIIDQKYRIERLLGAGGMGAVVEATHLLRRAPVALKFMSAQLVHDPAVVERFLNEGVAASRINNEHVVTVLDVSKLSSGQPYLVMEYLEGRDLAQLLKIEGSPGLQDISRCVHFVLQVLRGLQVAHAAGIIHRDLKPANCLVVERDGEPDFLKIVDFGISKVKSESLNLTKVGSALGTPLYVSPEQARDPASVDARGDLYSVSVILYELLSGKTPFYPASGQLSELFMALATQDPQPLETMRGDLPPGLDAAVLRGLAKHPDHRYASAADMAAALAPFADERSERVVRQMLQRHTLRPSGSPQAPHNDTTRLSGGVSSVGSPTEKVQRGSNPGVQRSGSSQPGVQHSSSSQPGVHHPGSSQPGVQRSGSSQPGVQHSSSSGSGQRISHPGARSSSPGAAHSPSSGPVYGSGFPSAPSPRTERVGSPATEFAPIPSGANWLTAAAPLDTAAPTTLPAFLKRRQTELKIGIPIVAALLLAGLLFKVLQSSRAPSDSLATPLAPVAPAQLEPRAGAAPAVAPEPTIRVVPGGSAVVAAPPGAASALPPGVQPVGPLPGAAAAAPAPTTQALQPQAVQPQVVQPQAVQPQAVQPQAVQPQAQPAPAATPPRPAPSSPPRSPNRQRRPSLKQIGIEE